MTSESWRKATQHTNYIPSKWSQGLTAANAPLQSLNTGIIDILRGGLSTARFRQNIPDPGVQTREKVFILGS